MDISNGHRRNTGRGSTHRTSFIEYVSEVYNARAGGGSERAGPTTSSAATAATAATTNEDRGAAGRNMMEALSIRGHSFSSGGSGVSGGGLSRDFSVRSEMGSNRVLGGGRHHAPRSKTSRVIGQSDTLAMKEKIGFLIIAWIF